MKEEQLDKRKEFFIEGIKILKSKFFLVVVFCLICVSTTLFLCFIQSPLYKVSSKIVVLPKLRKLQVTQFVKYKNEYLRHFYYNQFIILHSKNIAKKVVDSLDLRRKLSPYKSFILPDEIAINILLSSLLIKHSEDLNIIEVSFIMRDRSLAAEIANKYVEVYDQIRFEQKKQEVGETLDEIQIKLDAARKKLDASETKLNKITKEKELAFYKGVNIEYGELVRFNKDYLSSTIDRVTKEIWLSKLRGLSAEEKSGILALQLRCDNLIALKKLKAEQEIKLASLKSSFGSKHPDVSEAEMKTIEIGDNISSEVNGIVEGLEIDYKVVKEKENYLYSKLGQIKSAMSKRADAELEYSEAKREVEADQESYVNLKREYINALSIYELPEKSVNIFEPATPPLANDYYKPTFLLSFVASSVSSFFMGIILVICYGFFEIYNYNKAKLKASYFLSIIPVDVKNITYESKTSQNYEAFRSLATKLELLQRKENVQSIVITSAGAGEGKTTVSSNLAIVLGDLGKKVLLVDYNFKKPDIPYFLGLETPCQGIINLDKSNGFDKIPVLNIHKNVSFLPYGNPDVYINNPGDGAIVEPNMIKDFINAAKTEYDFILFDTAPFVGFCDTLIISSLVDGIIFVQSYKMSGKDSDSLIEKHISLSGSRFIGVVLNNVMPYDHTFRHYYQLLNYK